jgi:hypothetical protein
MNAAERFAMKVTMVRDNPAACWPWEGAKDGKGYGRFWLKGRDHPAHRISYEMAHGYIPDDLEIDHLCRNRSCVNPAHLEPVTTRENLLRGKTLAARNAKATVCVNGHPFTAANTYPWRGKRLCRTCRGEADRRRKAKAKGEA